MKKLVLALVIVGSLMASSGCISTSKYNTVRNDLESTQQQLSTAQEDIKLKATRLENTKGKLQTSAEKLVDAQKKINELILDLENKNAELMLANTKIANLEMETKHMKTLLSNSKLKYLDDKVKMAEETYNAAKQELTKVKNDYNAAKMTGK